MKKYQPSQFEAKWTEKWLLDKTYKANLDDKKKKMYVLDMFPYPSGAGLHVGHPRGYTATDILSRYYRMMGHSVIHPMGWDAFGLPAENAAIKAKTNPKKIVPQNIENFKRQMNMLGFSYDWDREFSTTDPEYYKWTQWLFIQFYKMGLLYKKNTPINYCPSCKTGLAEEEVLPNGTHERCGTPIEKRELPQWIFRITTYGDRLLEDLKELKWPHGILEMQKNWIGKKEGANIRYPVKNTEEEVVCFTTRPDTNFGATFVVLAPEHDFISKILSGEIKSDMCTNDVKQKIQKYVDDSKAKSDIDRQAEGRTKTGVFTGFYAINRLNGSELPIWISDFVLKDFGTGAVVGVPGHDQRDYEFAQKFGLNVIRVVSGTDGDTSPIKTAGNVLEEEGTVVNSDFLDGMSTQKAKEAIIDHLGQKGWGDRKVSYHLRDWIFSRQRYWGEPIPMVFCEACAKGKVSYFDANEDEIEIRNEKTGKETMKRQQEVKESMYGWFPIDDAQLPLELPDVESYEPLETGESPLAAISTFVNTKCPHCGGDARRETDTMPNWAGSCWYFIRFAQISEQSKVEKETLSLETWKKNMEEAQKWMPIDWYVGGAEHAVLHLLYARFWMKAMYDINLVENTEPFLRLRNVGMILAEDNRKMSKSWGNVINPDDVVKEFGGDALRVYEMFMAPFSQEIAWSTRTLQGGYRFLNRVWGIFQTYKDRVEQKEDTELVAKLNRTIDKVGRDIPEIKFNTAIASMMEFINDWEPAQKEGKGLNKENAVKFLKILAPFAPFMTEEIWADVFGEKKSIHLSDWPVVDESQLQESTVKIPVQVNGKVRGFVTMPATQVDKDSVVEAAMQDEKVKKFIGESTPQVIYVQGRILNFIVK